MMKRFEVIEPNGFQHQGDTFEFGDIRSHKDGQYFCDLGWAKCAETGEHGERIEGQSKIKPSNVETQVR